MHLQGILSRCYIQSTSVCLHSILCPVLKLVQTDRLCKGVTHAVSMPLSMYLFAGLGKAALWKTNIQQNAAALFSRRSADMQSLVYGTSAADTTRGKHAQQVSSLQCSFCCRHLTRDSAATAWLINFMSSWALHRAAVTGAKQGIVENNILPCWRGCNTGSRLNSA